jgi:hypothetical protein
MAIKVNNTAKPPIVHATGKPIKIKVMKLKKSNIDM